MSVRGVGSIPARGTRYVAPYKNISVQIPYQWFAPGTPISSTIKNEIENNLDKLDYW
jgi:hypothetical protein